MDYNFMRKIWFIIKFFFLDSWSIFKSREKLEAEKEALKKELEKIKKEHPDFKFTKKDQEFFDWLQNIREKIKPK